MARLLTFSDDVRIPQHVVESLRMKTVSRAEMAEREKKRKSERNQRVKDALIIIGLLTGFWVGVIYLFLWKAGWL